MKVIIEDKDWIEATKPAPNGCQYRLLFKNDGSVWMGIGCYHLVHLQTGFREYIRSKLKDGEIKIKCTPEFFCELLKLPNCPRCGAPLHQLKDIDTPLNAR